MTDVYDTPDMRYGDQLCRLETFPPVIDFIVCAIDLAKFGLIPPDTPLSINAPRAPVGPCCC